jgi:hypothetical protein
MSNDSGGFIRDALSLVAPDHGDWSYQEHREIDRIRAACEKHQELALEASRTDEGDPWCIVYDCRRDVVILHLARIDRRYVIAWPCRSRLQRTACIAAAAEIALIGLDREAREPCLCHVDPQARVDEPPFGRVKRGQL